MNTNKGTIRLSPPSPRYPPLVQFRPCDSGNICMSHHHLTFVLPRTRALNVQIDVRVKPADQVRTDHVNTTTCVIGSRATISHRAPVRSVVAYRLGGSPGRAWRATYTRMIITTDNFIIAVNNQKKKKSVIRSGSYAVPITMVARFFFFYRRYSHETPRERIKSETPRGRRLTSPSARVVNFGTTTTMIIITILLLLLLLI